MPPQLKLKLNSTLQKVREFSANNNQTLIAIDGRGGSGKSTLAREIAAALPGVSIIEFDWFHFPRKQLTTSRAYDSERFANEIVLPFRQGAGALRFKKYNWGYLTGQHDGLTSNETVMERPKILIVEGCQTLNEQTSLHFDLRLWVDTDAAEATRRGMHRDRFEYGLDPDLVAAQWQQWVERENLSLELDDRSTRAEVHVCF